MNPVRMSIICRMSVECRNFDVPSVLRAAAPQERARSCTSTYPGGKEHKTEQRGGEEEGVWYSL